MKRIAVIRLLFLCWAYGPGTTAVAQPTGIAQPDSGLVEITARELADRIVEYAETFLGTPYRYGANGPKRFDCTAYTRYVYRHFGYDELSRSAREQAKDGRPVDFSDLGNLQKGDILIIGSRRNPSVVGHVGIFIELDSTGRDPKFIHASVHGVRYSTMLTESYYSNRILGARRILPDFEDYEVVFDSTATYSFNPDEGVHIAPDSLVLSDADRRIVLFENGKWAYVAADGTLSVPDRGGRIILSGDGDWAPVREATVRVPGSSVAEPRETIIPADSTVVAAADTTNTAAAEPEKVYHTIKSGDTLSKIARQHHTTIGKLCELNGISSTTILRVGRKLRVK